MYLKVHDFIPSALIACSIPRFVLYTGKLVIIKGKSLCKRRQLKFIERVYHKCFIQNVFIGANYL